MGTKRDEAQTRSSKDVRKHTEVKSLPKAEEKLDQKEMKKIKGSIVGPCDRQRRDR
jgi:hypothetical protein